MNIDPDQIYHAIEPIEVKREDRQQVEKQVEKPLEKMCEVCGKPFTPHKLAPWAKYCNDPECVKHRHVVRQMEFYQRRPEYTGKTGRPRKVKPEDRSEQLKYYYKKKAGKVDSLEGKLKNI